MPQIRRATAVVGGLVVSLALIVTGCGRSGPATDPDPPTTASASSADDLGNDQADRLGDATQALAAAIGKAQEQPARVRFVMSGRSGETTEAHAEIDPENQRVRIESYFQEDGSTVMVTMILLEQDFYLMNGSGEWAGVWFHTDRTDLPPGGTFDTMAKGDLIGAAGLIGGVTTAEWTGENVIAGTVDLTRWSSAALPDLGELGDPGELGDMIRAVPFTAALDRERRLTDLSLGDEQQLPEVPKIWLRFGNFGRAETIEAPTYGEIVPMPEAMVAALAD
ncbi:hypothetical protein [Solwaraspora sp. WMMA2065]|uniref:hypothetical protein n=1 Tax=Solwaraspora sp. WMMA2065 TaxID=3015166 RepID=UPI00259BBF09|nr:hypothetical protein [Solwaraspora sp. WMMA2065]WJK34599.1 hypothetical protein O7610_29090 [Solwaraspora sp. WMMA2065]